jgi:hypothetical protein
MPLKYGDLENRTAQWFVSESKSQPFLDFFALVPTHDKWEFRAVQNTIGKTHSADLEQLKRVVGGVLAAGFELGDRVVIAYVIEDAGQQMNIGKDIHGQTMAVTTFGTTETSQDFNKCHACSVYTNWSNPLTPAMGEYSRMAGLCFSSY